MTERPRDQRPGVRGRPAVRVIVRPLAGRELDLVERYLPSLDREVHARRLEDQRIGVATYFVAWLGQRPVGHTLVRWNGSGNPVLTARLGVRASHPYIEGLAVHPAHQSRSIGTQILAATEHEAVRRGHAEIGLAVAVENVRARALYQRLGYRDAGIGEFPGQWSYVDDTGRRRVETEICVYLVKPLGAASHQADDEPTRAI